MNDPMDSRVWQCGKQYIHIGHNGTELIFKEMDDFINALLVWQEFALNNQAEKFLSSKDFWSVWSLDCQN